MNIIEQSQMRSCEIAVLRLIGQGKKNDEIAHELHIDRGTVATHVHMLRARLIIATNIRKWTRQQLVELARKEL